MSLSQFTDDHETQAMEVAEQQHVSVRFYKWQFFATLVWWILVKATTKKSLDVITNGSVVTRPSWLSAKWLGQYQTPSKRRLVFFSSVMALAVGGLGLPTLPPEQFQVRLWVALIFSLYHLVESSVTNRHGEYTVLYNVWAMCLPSDYATAVSLGIAIHFVMSTGIAKVWVGGTAWMGPRTMAYYLTAYHDAKKHLSRPLFPTWNRWACRRPWATQFMAVSTIVLECGVVPMMLFVPGHLRYIGSVGMVLMHVGILIFMSKKVGIVFCTTLPTYVVGFQCTAAIGSRPWLAAVVVSFLPTLGSLIIKGDLLPENWPSSPVSLFMWSGEQAKLLGEVLMTGDTRVVLGTADKTSKTVVGLPVLHHGAVAAISESAASASVVHDCLLRVIGFTLLHSKLRTAVPQPAGGVGMDEKMTQFVQVLRQFLDAERRLFETHTGRPLTQAWFVRLDDKGHVAKVLRV